MSFLCFLIFWISSISSDVKVLLSFHHSTSLKKDTGAEIDGDIHIDFFLLILLY